MIKFAARVALVCLGLISTGWAAIPANYYDTANTSSAAALRASLNDIVTAGHHAVGYSNVWAALKDLDEDPNNPNNVILIYTNQSRAKSAQCSNSCNDGDAFAGTWSREHLWPQSSFSSNDPMYSDLHALYPCDQDVNGKRSNNPFNFVTNPTYTAGGSEGNSSYWEPRPDNRGNIARAMFYMDIRYEGEGTINLVLKNNPSQANGAGEQGVLDTLLQWHLDDPVDAAEIARNNGVYDKQGNANPFVDHPEWVAIVYGLEVTPPTDGNTLFVTSTDRAPETAFPGDNIPLLSLHLSANSNEWDIDTISVTELGSLANTSIESINIYRDADNSGSVTTGDLLLDSKTLSGSTAALDLNDYRVSTTTVNFLITAKVSFAASVGETIQIQVNANGITSSSTGGADVNPTFAAITSGSTILTPPVTGEVLISEIMYNPSGADPGTEYVEIVNNSAASSILTDWYLQDEDGATGKFSVTLAAGEAAVLIPSTISTAAFQASWGTGFKVIQLTNWNERANSPTESNEVLTLRNMSGEIVDTANYLNGSPWPTNNNSASIYVLPSGLSTEGNDNGANWGLATVGTHGARANVNSGDFGNDVGSPGYVSIPPVIGVADSTILEDTPGAVEVAFTDLNDNPADEFTAVASSLSSGSFETAVVTRQSARTYVVTIPYTPAAESSGQVTFDLSVSDEDSMVNRTGLSFDVIPVNDPPFMSGFPNRESAGEPVGPMPFAIGDVETLPEDLVVSAFSDNETLVPNENILIEGTGFQRYLTVTPAAGQSGVANITVTVEDPEGEVTGTSFALTVTSENSGLRHWWVIE